MATYRTVRVRIKPLTRPLSALECARMGVHIDRVRATRVRELLLTQTIRDHEEGPLSPVRTCKGFHRPPHELPLLREYFTPRGPQGFHPLCRECKKAKRDHERALRVQA